MNETPNGDQPRDGFAARHEDGNRGHEATNPTPQSSPPRRKRKVPNEEQCLEALMEIPGMMLTGFLNTNQARVICGVYDIALQHYRQPKGVKAAPAVEQKGLIDAIRKQPSLLNSLAAFLSQDQVDELLKEIQDDAGEAA